jgi:hypothetical protein
LERLGCVGYSHPPPSLKGLTGTGFAKNALQNPEGKELRGSKY